jgi:hypothetical protein
MNNPSDFTRNAALVTGAHSGAFSRRKFLTRNRSRRGGFVPWVSIVGGLSGAGGTRKRKKQ